MYCVLLLVKSMPVVGTVHEVSVCHHSWTPLHFVSHASLCPLQLLPKWIGSTMYCISSQSVNQHEKSWHRECVIDVAVHIHQIILSTLGTMVSHNMTASMMVWIQLQWASKRVSRSGPRNDARCSNLLSHCTRCNVSSLLMHLWPHIFVPPSRSCDSSPTDRTVNIQGRRRGMDVKTKRLSGRKRQSWRNSIKLRLDGNLFVSTAHHLNGAK